jgi:hypothetical protein
MAYQFNNLWLGIVLWLVLYTCDYYLTLVGNRLRMQYATPYIEFEGSYEVNPFYKKDVDALRWVSSRFLLMATLHVFWLILLWLMAEIIKVPELFTIGIGMLLLPQLSVIADHFQNISAFNFMKVAGSIEGHIKYAYWMTVGLSARKFGSFALLWVALFCLTGNWLFVGGAIGSLRIFIRFNLLSAKIRRQPRRPIVANVNL